MLPSNNVPLFCLLFLTIQQTTGLECGLVNLKAAPWSNQTASKPHDLIIGGEEPQKNEMPWVVALFWRDKVFCTGSLIAPNYVLTAKHCIDAVPRPMNYFYVGYGSVEKKQMQKMKVVKTFDHPWADVSVIELESSIYTTPVCLPEDYNSECELDRSLVVAGLGAHIGSDYNTGGIQNGTDFEPSAKPSKSVLWTTIEHFSWISGQCWLYKPMAEFCAGGFSRGVLHGDSGGPVMKVEENNVVQVGVTSRGAIFAVNHKTLQNAIYVNVGYHGTWIDKVTNGTAQFRPVYDPCRVM